MEVEGAAVLVTGATGGIGVALVDAFAAAGATLVITGRREAVLADLARRHAATVVVADLATDEGLDAVVTASLRVDMVVANAALPASGTLESLSGDDIDRALAVNLRAPIRLAAALTPGMVARGRGHVVVVSSLSGIAASPASSLYSATKFGLRGFAHGLRQDLHGTGVGVSVLLPGFVRDAGMLADSGAVLPAWVGTSSPRQVADAAVRAVRDDRAEVSVGPVPIRVGAYLSGLFPGIAAGVTRRVGSDRIAREVAGGQAGWRRP